MYICTLSQAFIFTKHFFQHLLGNKFINRWVGSFSFQHLLYLCITRSVQYKPILCRLPMPNSNIPSVGKPPPPPLVFFIQKRFFFRFLRNITSFICFYEKTLFFRFLRNITSFIGFHEKTLLLSVFRKKHFSFTF